MSMRFAGVLVAMSFAAMGCPDDGGTLGSADAADTLVPGDAATDVGADALLGDIGPNGPTWYGEIQPLVAANCRPCHRPDGPASFAMDSYEATKPWAPVMATYAEQRLMPPFPVDDSDECTHPAGFVNDRRLDATEIALLRAWSDAGAPEGDPNTAAPAPTPEPFALVDYTDAYVLGDQGFSWSVTADQVVDDHRCFSIDLGVTEDTWLDGVEFIPGGEADKRSIVHHAVLFMDPDGVTANSATHPGGSYPCTGSPGAGNFTVVGGWTPGIEPFETPPDSAFRVPAGARLVIQLHYHPQGEDHTDTTTELRMRFRDQAPSLIAEMYVLGAVASAPGLQPGPNDPPSGPVFMVPDGAIDHTETMVINLPIPPVEIRVWSQFPHMHYVGTDLLATIERASGQSECSIHATRYDFNWQGIFQYDMPIDQMPRLFPGDKMRIRCTYTNNVNANPNLAEAIAFDPLISQTEDVYVGESTLDEMCLVVTGILRPNTQ